MRRRRARPAKKRRSAVYFFTAFFLTLAVFACGAGFLVVDRNTRRIGYSNEGVTLAMSSTDKQLDLTILGHSVSVPTQPFVQAAAVFQRARDSFSPMTSAPERLQQELRTLSLAGLLELIQKYFAQSP